MASNLVRIGNRLVGDGCPTYIIGEIGINHNGSLDTAKRLIDVAVRAGCNAVKFQKRTPEKCVPYDQWHIERETPWGRMAYIDYRRKVEFSVEEYGEIDAYCRTHEIDWFASPWDEEAVDFLEAFNPVCYKVASASLTDHALLAHLRETGRPIMISTGMSTMQEIEAGVQALGQDDLLIAHSTSTYPCPPQELNLRMVLTLKDLWPEIPIGYSGHETGLATTLAAVALGASFVERHITLDRAMWGSDQAASVEPGGLERLVKDIRDIEISLGDGIKRVYESEQGPRKKLRRVLDVNSASAKA